ncbi:MAG: hypothetical protein ACYTHM_25210, partial [Planctomycetota bacterium]
MGIREGSKFFGLQPRRAVARRRKGLWIAAVLIVTGTAAPLLPREEGWAPAVPAVRLKGKLGPPVAMELAAVRDEETGGGGGRSVTLRLTLTPGADLAGTRIDFLLPPLWTVVSGRRTDETDLVWGEARTVELDVLV